VPLRLLSVHGPRRLVDRHITLQHPAEPTDPPTHAPSKKYEIPDDDDDSEAEKIEKEIPKIGKIFLYVALVFVSIWLVCYFRDAISFFFGNVRHKMRPIVVVDLCFILNDRCLPIFLFCATHSFSHHTGME